MPLPLIPLPLLRSTKLIVLDLTTQSSMTLVLTVLSSLSHSS